jgi:hypothetical protein
MKARCTVEDGRLISMEKEKKMAREYSFKKESSFIRGSFMREKETDSAY